MVCLRVETEIEGINPAPQRALPASMAQPIKFSQIPGQINHVRIRGQAKPSCEIKPGQSETVPVKSVHPWGSGTLCLLEDEIDAVGT